MLKKEQLSYILIRKLTMIASFGFGLNTKHDRQPQWRTPPEKGAFVVMKSGCAIHLVSECGATNITA